MATGLQRAGAQMHDLADYFDQVAEVPGSTDATSLDFPSADSQPIPDLVGVPLPAGEAILHQ